MKSVINFAKLLAVVVLVTSCAYENDPGLQRKTANPKQADSDILADKTAAQKLEMKYKTLKAECALSSSPVLVPASLLVSDAADIRPPVLRNPVVNEGKKTTIDFLAQLAVDAKLEKEITGATMVEEIKSEDGTLVSKATLTLVVKPLTFEKNINLKVGSVVWVMKHSPKLEVVATIDVAGANSGNDVDTVTFNEQIPTKFKLLTTGSGSSALYHEIECNLKGEVVPEKEDLKDQWITVDCAQPAPTTGPEKAVYAASCKSDTAPPAETK